MVMVVVLALVLCVGSDATLVLVSVWQLMMALVSVFGVGGAIDDDIGIGGCWC